MACTAEPAPHLACRLPCRRYPLYITPSMVDTWRSEAQSTGGSGWLLRGWAGVRWNETWVHRRVRVHCTVGQGALGQPGLPLLPLSVGMAACFLLTCSMHLRPLLSGTFSFETHRDFVLNDPGARQHYQSAGHGGFSTSFGGGSGFGGGGGGGSW